ncbi:hypothetical protein ACE193_14425 [Bernardetia sp. OM2101]|uniref:hypothetical protein n=1 Tax=Bernardetia sp. OM2101 TaxID=3344876 RepID=UPI0035CF8FA3
MNLEEYREYYKKRLGEAYSKFYDDEMMKKSYQDYKEAINNAEYLEVNTSKHVEKLINRMEVDLPNENEVALFVMPSFEDMFYLKIDKEKIVKTSVDRNIPFKHKPIKTQILKERGKNIEAKEVDYLVDSITNAVKEAKVSKRGGAGLDGTDYFFIAKIENEVRICKKWSPYKKSKIGMLLSEIQKHIDFVFYDFGDDETTIRLA